MITKQMQILNETGLALIKKATSMGKVNEIEKCVNIGSGLMAQARDIMRAQQLNSILVFIEICVSARVKISYGMYCEFCARNSLEMYSEIDFDLRLSGLDDVLSESPV